MRIYICAQFYTILLYLKCVAPQQIYDVYQTVWDRSQLFTYTNVNPPINFVSPGTPASADIVIEDGTVYQTIEGFGATMTDSAASILAGLKNQNPTNYWNLLTELFDVTDTNHNAGFTYLRIPIGSTDFSSSIYTYDDVAGDVNFDSFNGNALSSNIVEVVHDIQSINSIIKFHALPWSPPAWMKSSDSIDGGDMQNAYLGIYPQYLYKCVQELAGHQINLDAISIQNEPQNNNPTYPTAVFTPQQMATVAINLRTLLNNGFSYVKIHLMDHNWDLVSSFAIPAAQAAGGAFDAASFHCYSGDVSDQETFHNAYPNMGIVFTECTGTLGTDWWSDIKWNMDNLMIGSLQYWSSIVGLWNLALNGEGQPELPGSNSCNSGNPGCRGVVTVNSDGSYSVNQEFYTLAHASKAIIPKDPGGPFGQRIEVSVQGSEADELVVGAYVTGRTSSSNWNRYSIVVLNWNDGGSSGWNPQEVAATIEFRGMQAKFTFPVGVTTLWWYAPNNGIAARATPTAQAHFHNAHHRRHHHKLRYTNSTSS